MIHRISLYRISSPAPILAFHEPYRELIKSPRWREDLIGAGAGRLHAQAQPFQISVEVVATLSAAPFDTRHRVADGQPPGFSETELWGWLP